MSRPLLALMVLLVLAGAGFVLVGREGDRPGEGPEHARLPAAGGPGAVGIPEEGLCGCAVLPDGSPAAGARVRLVPGDGGAQRSAETEADGGFRFAGVPAGRFRLEVTVRDGYGWPVTAVRDVEAGPGAQALRPDLVVRREGPPAGTPVLSLSVFGPDGPVREGMVQLHTARPWPRTLGRPIWFGEVRLPLAQVGEDAWLEVSGRTAAGERLAPWWTGPFPAKPGTLRVDLVSGRTVEGTVVDARGEPLAGVVMDLEPVRDPPGPGSWSYGSQARSDRDGRFVVGALPEGEQRLWVRIIPGPQLRPDAMVVRAGDRGVTVRLRDGITARVRVIDPDGKPVAGAHVHTVFDQAWNHSTTTGGDGRAALAGIDPALVHDLSVSPPPEREDLGWARVRAWDLEEVTVALPRTWPVSARVVDEAGGVLRGWQLAWQDGDGPWHAVLEPGLSSRPSRLRFASREGRLKPLPPGARPEEPGAVTVVGPDTGEISVVADVGQTLAVRVPGAEIRPYQTLTAWLYQAGDRTVRRQAIAEAAPVVFLFRGVAPGTTWDFELSGAGDRVAVATGLCPGGPEAVAPLGPGLEIQGRLVLPAGARPHWIQAASGDHRAGATPDADGRFVLRGLLPGRWRITARAQAADGRTLLEASADAEAGGAVILEPR